VFARIKGVDTTLKSQRLDKLLSNSGFGTRKEIKRLIKSGQVQVDSHVVKDGSMHIHPQESQIYIAGQKLNYKQFIYLMLNKPKDVVSATWDGRFKTVLDFVPDEFRHFNLFPVGRLDKDTEGLLLLTNDGQLAHDLLSPKKHVHKTYFAEVQGRVTNEDASLFKEGVILDDGYKTLPAHLEIINSDEISRIHLTIVEGKFHQVKRMFEAVDKKVIYLKRISMGFLKLDDGLKSGDVRELSQEELELLRG
jgi:16S rRNA pseudouridine516 synthase